MLILIWKIRGQVIRITVLCGYSARIYYQYFLLTAFVLTISFYLGKWFWFSILWWWHLRVCIFLFFLFSEIFFLYCGKIYVSQNLSFSPFLGGKISGIRCFHTVVQLLPHPPPEFFYLPNGNCIPSATPHSLPAPSPWKVYISFKSMYISETHRCRQIKMFHRLQYRWCKGK